MGFPFRLLVDAFAKSAEALPVTGQGLLECGLELFRCFGESTLQGFTSGNPAWLWKVTFWKEPLLPLFA